MKEIPLEEVLNLYSHKKISSSKIAEKYGCCKATILKRLRTADAKIRKAGVSRLKVSDNELKELYANKKLTTRKIAELFKCGRSTIHRKIAKLGIARDISVSHMKYPRKPFSGSDVEKAYLLGFAIGDLRVRKVGKRSKTIKVDCGSTKNEQIGLIYGMFSKYGHVWIGKKTKSGKKQIEAFVGDSFDFLLDGRQKAAWALKGDCFAPFLAGFTDAEGSIFITNGKAAFSIGNYDEELLRLLREGLLKRRIWPVRIYRARKRYQIAGGYKQKHHYWHLKINGKEQLLKLFNMLTPYILHEKRKEDIQKALKNIALRDSKSG